MNNLIYVNLHSTGYLKKYFSSPLILITAIISILFSPSTVSLIVSIGIIILFATARSKTKLLYVASAAGNIIIMLLCGIFVLSIKMECDFPETEWKYRFYIQSGMSSAKVRKGIIKECLLSGGLPVICGTIISILYCSMLLYAKHLQIEWVHRYFKGIILIVGAIWLLFAVFSLIFAYRNIRKIEGDSRDEKK